MCFSVFLTKMWEIKNLLFQKMNSSFNPDGSRKLLCSDEEKKKQEIQNDLLAAWSICLIPFILISNLVFMYTVRKTKVKLATADKLFIIQSICDILIGVIRVPTNLIIALNQDHFCPSHTLSLSVVHIIDRCTRPLIPFSLIISLGITLQRYLLVTKRDISVMRRRIFIGLYITSSVLYVASNIISMTLNI